MCNIYASTRPVISAMFAANYANFEHTDFDSYCPWYTAALFKEAGTIVQNLVISTEVNLGKKTDFQLFSQRPQ